MKTSRAHLVLAVTMGLLAVAATVAPQAAQATLMKTYTYTGNTFTVASAPFVGSSVTGSFTIDCTSAGGAGDCSSLAFDAYSSSITSFAFSAGPQTFTSGTASFGFFQFSTNSLMGIVEWDIVVGVNVGNRISTRSLSFDVVDRVIAPTAGGSVVDDPGTWTFTTATVPEPTTLALALFGLAALVLLLGRRRAMAAWARGRPVTQQLES